MFQIFYKYLILNKKAGIPGIGGFSIRRRPATLDFSNKTFISPSIQIEFNKSDVVEKKFYLFLAKEEQIDEYEAVNNFNNFTKTLTSQLDIAGNLELPAIGLLSKDVSGKIHFKPVNAGIVLYPNVTAERTIRNVSANAIASTGDQRDAAEAQEVSVDQENGQGRKDDWWIFAILLAIAAVAAIIYYYHQNGSFM